MFRLESSVRFRLERIKVKIREDQVSDKSRVRFRLERSRVQIRDE